MYSLIFRFVQSVFLCASLLQFSAVAQTLEQQLLQISSAELAARARSLGDPSRGAIAFFQAQTSCQQCHRVDNSKQEAIGPNLAKLDKTLPDESLVESVLFPSKSIRNGYESVVVLRTDGTVATGRLIEQTDAALILRDASRGEKPLTISTEDIDGIKKNPLSLMPTGQVNQLANVQQFYDLIKYLIEIRDGGVEAALKLQPQASQIALQVPEYEAHIDHAGFIRDWDEDSFARGEKIYRQVCQSCHGTVQEAGSLPTSLRFAQGKFKNGHDPYSMYRSITYGYGLMLPQTWMVPSQKYDVIHYIRKTYLETHNPTQYAAVDEAYLSKLPAGNDRGPEAVLHEPWKTMDYGSSLAHTYEIPGAVHNFAYKGVAVRLDIGAGGVAKGKHWTVFDTDTLRVAAGWSASEQANSDRFINWRSIQFNGEHNIHPTIAGDVAFANSDGPGWSSPEGSWKDDKRVLGRDGRYYGPLPKQWGEYRGRFDYGDRVIFSYRVAGVDILESPGLEFDGSDETKPIFQRTLNIGAHSRSLSMKVADRLPINQVRIVGDQSFAKIMQSDSGIFVTIGSNKEVTKLRIDVATFALPSIEKNDSIELDLHKFTIGGPARWPQALQSHKSISSENGPLAVEHLVAPESNPWSTQFRFTGLDFLSDGRIVACTWDGDVWLIKEEHDNTLQWRRIANGLFQPLGLKVIDDKIHLTCRDQLAVLHDLNHDEEIDFIECLNNDHQVTDHFHEFAMGLQTDSSGNFYYAKSARHALPAVVPQHGTLLRVSPDGSRTDIVATGFRAANGVCINPDGTFFVTDQEGHWNPKNRINWVKVNDKNRPQFFGNMLSYTDQTDTSDGAMEQPLCWITNAFDRSPAELMWVDSDNWGPLNKSLLNLSYGYGKIFLVPHEMVGGQIQGGMVELPLPTFDTGIIRGRFHPQNHDLYVCGMYSWAGAATSPGGLYRLRATGKPFNIVTSLNATSTGVRLKFSDTLKPNSISSDQFKVKVWSLKRTSKYGSDHFDERELQVRSVRLGTDAETVELEIPDIKPTWCMEITYQVRSAAGESVQGKIHNTIHRLGE